MMEAEKTPRFYSPCLDTKRSFQKRLRNGPSELLDSSSVPLFELFLVHI